MTNLSSKSLLNKLMKEFSNWLHKALWMEFVGSIFNLNEASWPEAWSLNTLEQPKFIDWLRSLGIEGQFGKPFEGSVGRAYPIGNFIVKFTVDRNEANAAATMKNYTSDNVAKVYDVKLIKWFDTDVGKKPLYAIVQEKINTDVSKKHRIAGQAIYSYLDNHSGFIEADPKIILPAVIQYLPKKYQLDQAIVNLVQQLLTSLKKIQDDRGFLSQDTHGANLGIKNRKTSIFDLGRSSLDFNNPATAGIRVNQLGA